MRQLRSWLSQHALAAFFVLAFAMAWAVLIPLALASRGMLAFSPSVPLLLFMSYAPTLAALIVTGAIAGRLGIRALLGRLLIWRVGVQWYAVAIFLNAGIILGSYALYVSTGGTAQPLPEIGPAFALNTLVTFVVVGLVNGEELGWRGFALPALQRRMSALVASLVIGSIAALFHLPIFFNEGPSAAGGQAGMPFAGFWISSVAASILMTWLYNNTRGSVLLAILFHASMNTWSSVLPFPTGGTFFWVLVGVQSAVALAVVALNGPARLSRKPEETQARGELEPLAVPSERSDREQPTDLAA